MRNERKKRKEYLSQDYSLESFRTRKRRRRSATGDGSDVLTEIILVKLGVVLVGRGFPGSKTLDGVRW
jgi:hypothetical protein